MADEKALVQRQSTATALNPIIGSLPEKVQAFEQIASAIASSNAFAGYDSVQKVKAACWAADALCVHPVAYMTGVYAVLMGGKLALMPKVEFEDGLLRSRLPGYDYTVHVEDAEVCDIEFFAEGRKSQRIRFTMEQAKKAKLSEKDTYRLYPDRMLFARAFHRGARRIGSHILAGLPDPVDYESRNDAPPDRERSAAEVLDEAAAVSVPAVLAPEEPAPIVDWYKELSTTLKNLFGRLTKEQLLAKASTVWAAFCKERGMDVPKPFTQAKDFGPVEAQHMVTWLNRKYPDGKAAVEGKAEPGPGSDQGKAGASTGESGEPERAPVSTAEPDAPPAMQEQEQPEDEEDLRVETVYVLAKSAKKSHPGRTFVQESPKGSTTFWFVDKEILTARGHSSSLMLQKDGDQRVSPEECRILCRMMREAGVA